MQYAFFSQNHNILVKDNFLIITDKKIIIRNRLAVTSLSLRKPENISLDEISSGIIATISESFGATIEELVIAISRILGFKSTSSILRARIIESIESLVQSDILSSTDNLLKIK